MNNSLLARVPDTGKVEIRRTLVQGQAVQKVKKTPSQQVYVVVHTCNPSYSAGVGRQIIV
jgi:hypothetical protein